MKHTAKIVRAGATLALAKLAILGGMTLFAGPAEAVVYCKTVGVPKGCVVRPAPVVVYCTAPGRPVGCVVRPVGVVRVPGVGVPGVGAPGVGVRGVPGNRGGPVNRLGVR